MNKRFLACFLLVPVLLFTIFYPANTFAKTPDSAIVNESISYGNDRYKWQTKTTYGNWSTKTITITQQQANTSTKYKNAIIELTAGLIPDTVLSASVEQILKTFYSSPYDSAGKYVISIRSYRIIKENILTGATSLQEKGYEIKVTHNNTTSTKKYSY